MNESIDSALSKLETEIRAGKKTVFGNLRSVDEGICIDLIAQVRDNLPQELAQARVVLQERQSLLEDAQKQCDAMLEQAGAQQAQMLSQNEIVIQAQAQAAQIVEQAQKYAQDLIAQAERQILDMMNATEYYMGSALATLSANKQEVVNRMAGAVKK